MLSPKPDTRSNPSVSMKSGLRDRNNKVSGSELSMEIYRLNEVRS